jgi:hypothetical protein
VALVHPFSDGSLTRLSLRPGLRERALTPFVPGGPAAQQLTARDGRWRVCAALAIDAAPPTRFLGTYQERRRALPLYAARIEDLGQGDFVKVDCAACHHVAL